MKLYLDSSALVKLVQREAVSGGGAGAIAHARRTLARVDQIQLDRPLLDEASTLAPSAVLRSLDAIHLASARLLGSDLRAVVTYDVRMIAIAAGLGMPVEGPGRI